MAKKPTPAKKPKATTPKPKAVTPKAKAPKAKSPATKGKTSTVTVDDILKELKSMGNEKMRAMHQKNGAGDNLFGVKMGDIRIVANKIKKDHELALALWQTGNIDAQLLATLIMKPASLTATELEKMVQSATFPWLADWFHSYVIKEHTDKESLREKWMVTDDKMCARAGWRLTAGRVAKSPEGLDLEVLLNRIESEMSSAASEVQWTMNSCLAEIGINFPKHRKRAIAIGEKLGIYRDYPCSKGCTSPFAPIWINEMVKRQG